MVRVEANDLRLRRLLPLPKIKVNKIELNFCLIGCGVAFSVSTREGLREDEECATAGDWVRGVVGSLVGYGAGKGGNNEINAGIKLVARSRCLHTS